MTFGAAAINQYAHLYGWYDYEDAMDDDPLPTSRSVRYPVPSGREWKGPR